MNTEWLMDSDMKVTFGKLLGEEHQINKDAVHKSIELLAEELPVLKQYVARFEELYANIDDIDYVYTLYEDLEVPPVLVMGDLWVNNVLWKRDDQGEPTTDLAAVLDWQVGLNLFGVLKSYFLNIHLCSVRAYLSILLK